MSHSNSSLNCFASCMSKYKISYIDRTPPEKVSPHLIFGTMAHEVLYNAGKLRDDTADGVVSPDDYYKIIPSEVLYPELKQEFNIKSWQHYFTDVIKQTAEYERTVTSQLGQRGAYTIEREVKLQATVEQLKALGYHNIAQTIVGIVDLLIYTKDSAIILDYKFSSSRKNQDDFDMNSQLPLYAFLVHLNYGIPLRNIQIGYIDIPKQEFGAPIVLSNGHLSRSKSQNCSQYMFKAFVDEIYGPDDEVYNCEPGGYYYDIYCNLALNKAAYLSLQWLDLQTYDHVIKDLLDAAKMIDFMQQNEMPFLRKYDSYTCKSCEHLRTCKPWLYKAEWE